MSLDEVSLDEKRQHAIARAVFLSAPGKREVTIERVFSSLGAGNVIVFAADKKRQRYVLKVRAARGMNAQAEAWGLKAATRARHHAEQPRGPSVSFHHVADEPAGTRVRGWSA